MVDYYRLQIKALDSLEALNELEQGLHGIRKTTATDSNIDAFINELLGIINDCRDQKLVQLGRTAQLQAGLINQQCRS